VGQAKIWGAMAHPSPHLESPLLIKPTLVVSAGLNTSNPLEYIASRTGPIGFRCWFTAGWFEEVVFQCISEFVYSVGRLQ